MKSKVTLSQGECLKLMSKLPDACVDLILCDLPYGTTQNKWDTCIDLVELWKQYKRICTGAIVLTAAQPFTSVLVMSNVRDFKYQWVWDKVSPTGHLNSKKQPMRRCEEVLVFYAQQPVYNPQMTHGHPRVVATRQGTKSSSNWGNDKRGQRYESTSRFPAQLLTITKDDIKKGLHPTQKPVALMEYMIKTYTHEGMTVLDNCMGSGTTGVACVNLGRHFIGMEQDAVYFVTARVRIKEAQKAAR